MWMSLDIVNQIRKHVGVLRPMAITIPCTFTIYEYLLHKAAITLRGVLGRDGLDPEQVLVCRKYPGIFGGHKDNDPTFTDPEKLIVEVLFHFIVHIIERIGKDQVNRFVW